MLSNMDKLKNVHEDVESKELRRRCEQEGKKFNSNINEDIQNDDINEDVADLNTLSDESNCENLIKQLYSINEEDQLKALQKFNKLLTSDCELNSYTNAINSAGIIPRFVEFLDNMTNSRLQHEASLAIINIATGTSEQILQKIVEANAIPAFMLLLESPNEELQEDAVWAFGTIACSRKCRDIIMDMEIMQQILNLVKSSSHISVVRTSVYALSNLCCKTAKRHDFTKVSQALPVFAELLTHSDTEILADTCLAVSNLSKDFKFFEKLIDAGICPKLVELLMHTQKKIVLYSLRTFGNLCSGDDIQTELVLNCSVLPCLRILLGSCEKKVVKYACIAISNITAGNKNLIQAVLNENIFPPLIHVMATTEFKIRREAALAIKNATLRGTQQQIQYLVEQECIPPLCDLLTVKDMKYIQLALDSLENILKSGELLARQTDTLNLYAVLLKECYGLDKIELLLSHENIEIYQKACGIIESYFDSDKDNSHIVSVQVAEPGLLLKFFFWLYNFFSRLF